MIKPVFSVITTGRGEKNVKAIEETFTNWEITKKVFESKTGKKNSIEFIVVDAGENADLPKIENSRIISPIPHYSLDRLWVMAHVGTHVYRRGPQSKFAACDPPARVLEGR